MRLRSYTVEGYKAFADETEVELRPLTLLYGYNHVGKSALLRVLPLLAESVSARKRLRQEEAFAGISGYRTSLVANDVRQMAKDGKPRWSFPRPFRYRSLPARSTFRSVRVKALALRLAALQEHGGEILSRYHNKALGHLLPRSEVGAREVSNLGNRILVNPIDVWSREDLKKEEFRTRHVITDEAVQYLRTGDHRSFVERRLEDLRRFEHQFVEILQKTFVIDDSSIS